MNATTTATTTASHCPPWCSNDHTAEPADHHIGREHVSSDVDVILSQLPGEGFSARLSGPDGEISLSPAGIARLAAVTGKLTAAIVAAARSQQG